MADWALGLLADRDTIETARAHHQPGETDPAVRAEWGGGTC